jgi:hypothetical protein
MVLLCSFCVPDPGPGFTTSLVTGTQTEHNNIMTSDVVNPGPGSGTQTEHNNTMTSDVVNPGPGVCVSDPGPGFTTSLVMVLLCSVCVPDPSQGLGQAHKLNTIIP